MRYAIPASTWSKYICLEAACSRERRIASGDQRKPCHRDGTIISEMSMEALLRLISSMSSEQWEERVDDNTVKEFLRSSNVIEEFMSNLEGYREEENFIQHNATYLNKEHLIFGFLLVSGVGNDSKHL